MNREIFGWRIRNRDTAAAFGNRLGMCCISPKSPKRNHVRKHFDPFTSGFCECPKFIQSRRIRGTGDTALTRMWRAFKSVVHVRVKEQTAPGRFTVLVLIARAKPVELSVRFQATLSA